MREEDAYEETEERMKDRKRREEMCNKVTASVPAAAITIAIRHCEMNHVLLTSFIFLFFLPSSSPQPRMQAGPPPSQKTPNILDYTRALTDHFPLRFSEEKWWSISRFL